MKIIQQLIKRFDDMRSARDSGDARLDLRGKPARVAATPAPFLMALEPRVVYDASVAAVAPQHHGAEAQTHAGAAASTEATVHAAPKTIAEHDVRHGKSGANAPAQNSKPANQAGTADPQKTTQTSSTVATQKAVQTDAALSAAVIDPTAAAAAHAVVFIDPSVVDYQSLIAGLPAGTQYVVLNANTDGFAQIAQYLQTHQGIQSIHLISHGSDGEIQAGAAWLNSADLSDYSADLTAIGAAMAPGGDFLIYGCDVAEHADGQALVQQIAAITHLNVAASTDLTGSSAVGGNWTLEYDVGNVHTPVLLSAAVEQAYDHVLATNIENYTSATGFDTGGDVTSFTLDGLIYTFKDVNGNPIAIRTIVTTDSFLQALADENSSDNALQFNQDSVPGVTSIVVTRVGNTPFNFQSIDLDVLADNAVTVYADSNTADGVSIPSDGNFTATTVTLTGHASFADAQSITISGGNLFADFGHLVYADVGPSLTASTGSAAFTAGDNTASTPVVVDSHLTLTDTTSTGAKSATITISNVQTGDELLFTPSGSTGNISAVFSGNVLTLSSTGGTATIAQWQTALESITFTNTQITPNTATRTISFSITDNNNAVATATRTLTVADTDQTPIVHTSGGATTYVAGATAATIDSGVTVTDSDTTHQSLATVTIGNAGTGDTLAFSNTNTTLYGNITGLFAGTTLTLNGSATDAQWQAALDAVTFSSGAGTTSGARTISFSINDGTKTSASATKTLNVSPVPIVTTDSGSASFVSADNATSTPVTVDSGITVAENGGAGTLASVSVQITTNFQQGQDSLLYVNNPATMGDISGSYNASTGLLTLTSASHASLAQWQAALRSITYTDTAASPATPMRTISFTANDGSNSGPIATRTVTVTATDNTPIVTLSGGSTSYVAGAPGVVVDSGVSVTDRDSNPTLTQAQITITNGVQTGDTLVFVNDSFVTGSYDSTNHILTLTASGSVSDAQWNTELDKIQFSSAANATAGARTLSYVVNDGTKLSNAVTRTVNVVVAPVVTTDSGSAAFVAGDNTASTPLTVDSALTVSDGSSTTLVSATVQITSNFNSSEDLLIFTPSGATGDIAGSYNASNGLLTLTSASHATLAQWQAALRAVAYDDLAVTPNNATRTISFIVNDGANNSPVATRTVAVQDTDQTPIVTLSGSNSAYTAGSAATIIDNGITISDLDNSTLASATVSIGAGFHVGDTLALSSDSFVTSSYDATHGILTLTATSGNISVAQWMSELDNVTFSSAPGVPAGARTVSFTVNDGTESSAVVSRTVTVTAVPVLTTDSGSAAFVAGDNIASTPVAVDSGLTLADSSSTTLVSATVQITSNFNSSEDLLIFTPSGATGDIAGSYNASNGLLTLSSASHATLAQWQAALRAVAYDDLAVTPNNATRTISFTVNDGANSSPIATRTVTVTDTDQTPLLTTTGGSTAFVEADNVTSTPVAIDSGVTISDLDNSTLAHATVSITGNLHSGEDVLAFSNTNATLFGDISGTYNALTGTMQLSSSSGTATLAQWQAALRAVTYTDTAITPNTANRTISFSVNDGAKDSLAGSKTVSVTGVDQSPVLSASSGNFDYLPGAAAHNIDSGITLTDSDSTTMASATIQFSSGFQSGDQLSLNYNAATMGFNFNITFDAAAGTLTITRTGAMTLSNWQAIIDNVQFSAAPGVPLGTRALSVVTSDGVKDSNTLTYNVDVISSAPQLSTTSTGSVTFTAGDNVAGVPIVVDGGLSVLDPLGNPIVSAMVSITGNYQSDQDVLLFVNDGATMGDIFGNFNAATGVLTLTSSSGTATDGQWAAAMRAVTFTDTAVTPDTASRSISFQITDGTQNSTTLIRTVTVADTDQTPILATASTGSASFVAGDNATSTPVAIDTGITVSDRDNGTLASATFQIGAGFNAGEDVLAFTNDGATMGNITASYDAVHGTLTLSSASASATLAQWQAALRSVTYTDTAVTPDNTMRTISFTVNDGAKNSAALTRSVTVADTDQTPIVGSTGTGSATFVSGDNGPSTPVVIDNGITVSDLDNTTLGSATVQIGAGFHAGEDVLGFTNDGATMGNITVISYDAVHGTLTLSSTGATATLAQWQSALRSVTYVDTAVTPSGATRTIDFTVNDGTNPSAVYARNVDVTAADQTPILTTSVGSSAFVAGDNVASTPVVIDNGVTVSDLDNTTLASATVQIGTGFHSGEDVLAFTNDGATMGNITASYDAVHGTLTLSSTGAAATLAQWQSALRSVTYTDTAVTPDNTTRTISFTVNDGTKDSAAGTKGVTVADVDQTPVTTTSSGNTAFVSGDNATSTPVTVDSGLSVSDRDNATLASATVSITTGFHAGEDVLSFTNGNATTFGNITASFDATTGVLTLTSAGQSATVAQWQAALRAVTYIDTALLPDSAQRTVSFTVNDGQKDSAVGTKAITVTATDQTPLVTNGDTSPLTFNSGPNAQPVTIASQISVTDADSSATLASATVSISGGFHADRDVLAFTGSAATGNIVGSYDATTGVLTLNSAGHSATFAQWQAALAAVTYVDSASETVASSRTISFSVNDGQKSSVPSTRTVNIAAAPVTVTQPTQSTQPMPANQVTLPPRGNGAGAASSATQSNTPNAPSTSAPDIVITFPRNLTDSISNPLIVLDAFAEAPEVGSIPAIHTATFSADEIGTSSYANSGSVGGSNHHGSLSDTSVGPIDTTPAPTSAPLSLDLPALAMHLNVAPDQAFVVSLPVMLGSSEGLPVGADAHVELRLADGRPLPNWLHYDPVRGTLSGKVPANQRGLQIAIIAHDAQGHQTRRDVAIEFGGASRSTQSGHAGHDTSHGAAHPPAVAPNATRATPATTPHAALPFNSPPLAKPSLAEQFVRAHATLHVARPVNAAATTVAPETASRGHA
ncbi:DUF4347 domain-containing protein [Burkholderia sp. 9120]|uniref:DUF4347 domain-containing protein n=1 Tax=Burkholderia sp. 9120 TaxID=1500897 RepID=UPI00068CAF9E|nr:DUF4347 domain-containing protein [Burkholderia sp. 9120]